MEYKKHSFFEDPQNRLPAYDLTLRDGVYGAVFFLLSVLAVDFGLFGGFRLGFSIVLTAFGIALPCYFSRKGRLTGYGLFYNACAVFAGISYGLFDSGLTKFAAFIALCLLFSLEILSYGEVRDRGDIRRVADVASALIVTPFSEMGEVFFSFRNKLTEGEKSRKNAALLVGLLAAVPAVCMVIPLLMSSDAAFEGLMSLTVFSDVPRAIAALILGLLLFCYVFSGILAFADKRGADLCPEEIRGEKGIDVYGTGGFLGVICGVYCIYILSQAGYFFGAFSSLLPENFTVAEYARRGFFEMVVISLINLVLMGLSLLITKRKEGKISPVIRGMCAFLCVFSVGLCVTVCAKLFLYIRRFGLTHLRLYTTAASILIAVFFLLCFFALFRNRFPYFRIFTILGAVFTLILCFADANTLVCACNLRAYETGWIREIDMDTISRCGGPGTETLIRLMDDPDEDLAREAAIILLEKYDLYGENDSARLRIAESDESVFLTGALKVDKDGDFRTRTLARDRAKRAYERAWPDICRLVNEG